MTSPDRVTPAVEALVLAELAKRVKGRIDAVKAIVGTDFAPGDKQSFRSPLDGAKVGLIWRTDPDPQWRVVDPVALDTELRTFPGNVVTTVGLATEDEAEAFAVLAEHSPHLLTETRSVAPGVVDAALAQSAATGTPAAAGIELVQPGGSLTVKPDVNAGAAVERLVAAGVITWDGRPVLDAPAQQDNREAS